ncbi:MAG: hypothetical protein ABI024_03000 [Vicinamibacterales bacterium]
MRGAAALSASNLHAPMHRSRSNGNLDEAVWSQADIIFLNVHAAWKPTDKRRA